MTDTLRAALLFLVTAVFDAYLYILMIRLILVWGNADYYNPIIQFIAKCTDAIIKPIRRRIPNYRHLESATLLVIFVLSIVKYLLLCLISFGMPNFLGVIILAIGNCFKLVIDCFFYAILLQALLSWIQPGSPINDVLYQFNSPLMRPAQRMIPPISGIDISPIPVLLMLQLLIIIVVSPLLAYGLGIAIS